MPAPIRIAAGCYSSSQLAAIPSTVSEARSISAPVCQRMFTERTVCATSADTCNHSEGAGGGLHTPRYEQQGRLQGRKSMRCRAASSSVGHKVTNFERSFAEGCSVSECRISTSFMDLVLNVTLKWVISRVCGFVLPLPQKFKLVTEANSEIILIYYRARLYHSVYTYRAPHLLLRVHFSMSSIAH